MKREPSMIGESELSKMRHFYEYFKDCRTLEQCSKEKQNEILFHQTPLGKLIHKVEWLHQCSEYEEGANRHPDRFTREYEELGMVMSGAIVSNDVGFFETLLKFLQTRKKGKIPSAKILTIPAKSRGRKTAPYDYCFTFFQALVECYRTRLIEYAGNELTTRLVGRKELKKAIQEVQKREGLKNPTMITESELSRWINANELGCTMAEKPIARKRPRKT